MDLTRAWIGGLVLPLLLAACAGAPDANQDEALQSRVTTTVAETAGEAGGIYTMQEKIKAKVVEINREQRMFVLEDDAGHRRQVQAPPEMVNFAQLAVGDVAEVDLVKETIVYVTSADSVEEDGSDSFALSAAEGEKPALIAGEGTQITATVIAVDVENYTATLEFADRSLRTVPVRRDIDLSPLAIGKKVVIITSTALAVSISAQ